MVEIIPIFIDTGCRKIGTFSGIYPSTQMETRYVCEARKRFEHIVHTILSKMKLLIKTVYRGGVELKPHIVRELYICVEREVTSPNQPQYWSTI